MFETAMLIAKKRFGFLIYGAAVLIIARQLLHYFLNSGAIW
jgi:hypothetical protein